MNRKEFGSTLLGLIGLSTLVGCTSKMSKSAYDPELGDPYKCSKCGHVLRSKEDKNGHRCPVCFSDSLGMISEEEASRLESEAQ